MKKHKNRNITNEERSHTIIKYIYVNEKLYDMYLYWAIFIWFEKRTQLEITQVFAHLDDDGDDDNDEC